MKRFILTDWAYVNCVVNNAPDGFIPWGYAVVETEDTIKCLNTIGGEVVRETEKAIQLCFTVGKTAPARIDIVKSFKWNVWIPKSQIVNGEALYYDGGTCGIAIFRYMESTKKRIIKTRFSMDY